MKRLSLAERASRITAGLLIAHVAFEGPAPRRRTRPPTSEPMQTPADARADEWPRWVNTGTHALHAVEESYSRRTACGMLRLDGIDTKPATEGYRCRRCRTVLEHEARREARRAS